MLRQKGIEVAIRRWTDWNHFITLAVVKIYPEAKRCRARISSIHYVYTIHGWGELGYQI